MTLVRVPWHNGKGCIGVKMEDGTVYPARHGTIDVQDPSHIRAMKKDVNIAGDIIEAQFCPVSSESKICSCGFTAYKWQKDCPRCGADLREVSVQ